MKHLIDPGPSRKGWHRLQKVLTCPRLYALSYLTDAPPVRKGDPPEPLVKGSMLHVALAHHYADGMEEYADKDLYTPTDAVQQLIELQPNDERAAWQRHAKQVCATYADYNMHWGKERWKPMGIETELMVNIFDEKMNRTYLYTQRVDLAWRHPMTGKVWFVDHKTTARWTPQTLSKYSMNGQFLGYQMIGEKKFGDDWGGVLLNVIEWGKGGGSPTFKRMPVDPAPHSVERFRQSIIRGERTLLEYENMEPKDWPGAHHDGACWPYRQCKFYSTCQWGGK
jgi:hypothetical protein